MRITLYSRRSCPKSHDLKRILNDKGIEFVEIDSCKDMTAEQRRSFCRMYGFPHLFHGVERIGNYEKSVDWACQAT